MNHSEENIYLLAMSEIIIGVLTALYVGLLLFFALGLLRAKRASIKGPATLGVSVIVPLRNEEAFVTRTLNALEAQDYKGKWEVICVNDRSTDQTPALLESFAATHPRFSVVHIPLEAPFLESPKKRALETGFAHAKYEILMTMDADCIPPKCWVTSMASQFVGNISIVQGPKKNTGSRSLVHTYQKLETLGYTCIEAAGFSMGTPMVASAAALAYKKDLFFKVGGFGDLVHLSSGDDDMLVHKMVKEPNVDFCYNLDPEAVVETAPVDSWRGLLNQRARWASNSTNYSNHAYTFLLTLIYTFYVWLLLSPWLAIFAGFPWEWFLIPFACKIIADTLFLTIGAVRLRISSLLFAIPHGELLQIPLIVLAVPMGIFKIFKWK